ncbi:alpha/beta-hydrolase [Hypoxylon sp. FL0543]|nr:alpha/beta-hydrolase [Hypoxylon sp. FL0543]
MAPVVARLVSVSKPYLVPGKLLVKEYWFEVPLNHDDPKSKPIRLFARSAIKYERPIVESSEIVQRPYLVYLQGGPGGANPPPQDSPLSGPMLDRGYELLFLDQRGTGLSNTVSANTLELIGGPQEQADYLKHFRADTLVKDYEAVRLCLTKDYPPEKKRWSTFGQSFGGMMTLTYLSFAPEGLRECFITGGLAALDKGPDEVYAATYRKVIERNEAYYKKFPEDIATVKFIAERIRELGGQKGIPLPDGGFLTVQRLMATGIHFGTHGGLDRVHNHIVKMKGDLDQFGIFTRATLDELGHGIGFDTAPIYSVLHEPIWCYAPGIASRWAAERVGKTLDQYQWLREDWAGPASLGDKPLYFSGEMIYPSHFETWAELIKLKETAHILAQYDQWPPLYDIQQLAKNEIPVYAASYNDMYVDVDMARETASRIKGIKVFETNVLYHNALRARTEEVIPQLLKLRDDTID